MTDDLTKLPEGWTPADLRDAIDNVKASNAATVRLIAAAPDLLAACVQAYGDLIEGNLVDIEKLARAIAKAEGRS